ncbi:LysM peptidoglycan-binding domain-containing protein [Nocardioides terrisoli]|uniref:LysM peptidoglycan-binding domain-containing protein n=1 Tax=Nocardioides terrisoli TaxID=3388267 RepID=UPI00287B5FFE|nr:LysM peptidoglycan-binding domain-containing protein [Nocardioides marmorisolisilvae]
MSTMTISPIRTVRPVRPLHVITDAPVRRPVARVETRSALRLTRRGRAVFLVAFLALLVTLMVAFGGLATATHDSGTPDPVRIVEIGPGDTLYGLAGSIAAPGHVRDMVSHIEQLNSLSGPELQVGQRLALPLDSGATN